MIIVLARGCDSRAIASVLAKAEDYGLRPEVIDAGERTLVLLRGGCKPIDIADFTSLPCVERVVPLGARGIHTQAVTAERLPVRIGGATFGASEATVIAGPCAVESLDQALIIADSVKKSGAKVFRAGAFKPRTSPYTFQGLGEEGLRILAQVREQTGLLIVTEAMDSSNLELVAGYADIVQIGSRNMQNYPLLSEVGKLRKPILLKRGMAATVEEWLMAAEYIMTGGNERVILCERGVRTFSDHSRFTLDLGVVPAVKELCSLPVIVDPSHGTGRSDRIPAMACAALAAGADGLMLEVHHMPEAALSDGAQALDLTGFAELMDRLRRVAAAVDIRL